MPVHNVNRDILGPGWLNARHGARLIARAILLLILATTSLRAQSAASQERFPFKPCATDRTYKFFEEIQWKAYTAEPTFMQMLSSLQDVDRALASIDQTGKELAARTDLPGAKRDDDTKETSEFIRRSLSKLRLPTCYENRYIFWMLKNYAQQIDDARRSLRLPLKGRPKIATLPTTEINAYTYPAESGRDSVVAFNTQLFLFAYQMTKVTLPTIGIERVEGKVGIDRSRTAAIRAIAENNDLRLNFTMALLEFLLLVDPDTQPLAPSYDPLVITFTTGMEMFAVAHEYGHVIRNHASPTMQIRLGATPETHPANSAGEVSVYARSWQQELEADAVGIQLLTQALRKSAAKSDSDDLRWLYSLKGALFFFKSLDLVDRAKYLRDNDHDRPMPSVAETVFLRDLADGKATDRQRERFGSLRLGTHPPAWLRLERARLEIDKALHDVPQSEAAVNFSQIAEGLIENIDLVWLAVEDQLPRAIQAARIIRERESRHEALSEPQLKAMADEIKGRTNAPDSSSRSFPPGCRYDASAWMSSFLCNISLQRAVARFIDGEGGDVNVLESYGVAVREDPVLLAGKQLLWAQDALERGSKGDLDTALAVIALSGDKDGIRILRSVSTGGWTEQERELLTRAESFLASHGRDTTVTALEAISPDTLPLAELLVYPSGVPSFTPKELASGPMTRQQLAFVSAARAVDPRRSLAGMALYMLQSRTDASAAYSFWADVLLRSGAVDAALRLALAGANRVGPDGNIETAIGNVLSKQGKWLEANRHYEASLTAGRNDGWPEVNIAKNLVELGRFDDAEALFRRALAKRDSARSVREFASYLNEFAWFVATHRKDDSVKVREALAMSREANDLVRRSDANFLDTLAECEAAAGNLAVAVDSARAALALVDATSPDRPQYERRLAEFESRAKK